MNYFFYKDYMFNKMIKHSESLWVSSLMISIIELSNGLSICLVINKYLFSLDVFSLSMVPYLIIGVVAFVLNGIYYTKNEERICAKYKGEGKILNILGYIVYVFYYIGSIGLVLLLIKKRF